MHARTYNVQMDVCTHACMHACRDACMYVCLPSLSLSLPISFSFSFPHSLLTSEQSDTLRLLCFNDGKSRHRRIERQRRYATWLPHTHTTKTRSNNSCKNDNTSSNTNLVPTPFRLFAPILLDSDSFNRAAVTNCLSSNVPAQCRRIFTLSSCLTAPFYFMRKHAPQQRIHARTLFVNTCNTTWNE